MVCMFSFYCTKLHPNADDGGPGHGDEIIPELDQQDVDTFNKYHYPGVPVLSKVHDGGTLPAAAFNAQARVTLRADPIRANPWCTRFTACAHRMPAGQIEKDKTVHSIIVKWQHEELSFTNKESDPQQVLKDLAKANAAQGIQRHSSIEVALDHIEKNVKECNVKEGACPAAAWELLGPKIAKNHGKNWQTNKKWEKEVRSGTATLDAAGHHSTLGRVLTKGEVDAKIAEKSKQQADAVAPPGFTQ